MPKVFDVFPFFNELDVLEIRLNELAPVVDKFLIVECRETFGGDKKPLYFADNRSRFQAFADKIEHRIIDSVEPRYTRGTLKMNVPGVKAQDIRNIGRAREASQRNMIAPMLASLNPDRLDAIIFSDCDEIPSASGVRFYLSQLEDGIARFKQHTFYYNVNCLIDYGRDICSRARIGRYENLLNLDSDLYKFRMAGNKVANFPAIENGGWHFSYFGGDIAKLHEKVNALNPFLTEYKLFGDHRLVQDILNRKDLHHRPVGFSELPETFSDGREVVLPAYYLANQEKFKHFTAEHMRAKYGTVRL